MPQDQTDKSSAPRPGDLWTALALLSRLPLPAHDSRGAAAAWAWPVAGALLGTIAGAVGLVALTLGLPPALAAGLALATGPVLTGALHEDGLADTADGLWGGWTRDRRLAIMKDSHIGTYGVIALILSLGLRWIALTLCFQAGYSVFVLIGAAAVSRLPMVALAWHLPHARSNGLSHAVGRPTGRNMALATALTVIITAATFGPAAAPALFAVLLATILLARVAKTKIGGQTGDILGAAQQLSEVAALITLATLLS